MENQSLIKSKKNWNGKSSITWIVQATPEREIKDKLERKAKTILNEKLSTLGICTPTLGTSGPKKHTTHKKQTTRHSIYMRTICMRDLLWHPQAKIADNAYKQANKSKLIQAKHTVLYSRLALAPVSPMSRQSIQKTLKRNTYMLNRNSCMHNLPGHPQAQRADNAYRTLNAYRSLNETRLCETYNSCIQRWP